jgi:hypothetical protein
LAQAGSTARRGRSGRLRACSESASVAMPADPGAESFRTCGLRSEGPSRLEPRKSLSRAQRSASVPTIPSRYEVTLLKGDLEHKGFGTQQLRFKPANGEEVPGPGNYAMGKSGIEQTLDRACWGIRGTGGFASRSKRFGARSMPSAPPAGLGCPGPIYDAHKVGHYIKDRSDHLKAGYTSKFAPFKERSDPSANLPGPGQYGLPSKPEANVSSVVTASFKSTAAKLPGTSHEMGPGPGEYYADHEGKKRGEVNLGVPSDPAFKDMCARRIARVHPDLPAASRKARDLLGKFGDEVGQIKLGTVGSAADLPGPGHYKQDRDAMWKGNLVGANGHSSFQPGPARSEFAPEELGLLPGPGNYEPNLVSGGLKLTSASSAFNSASLRGILRASDAPGPCYYGESFITLPAKKKTFRLDQKKEFCT